MKPMPPEPFEKVEKEIDDLDEYIKNQIVKWESLVVAGQNMANLLSEFIEDVEGDPKFKTQVKEAKEMIWRWEKEFKNH